MKKMEVETDQKTREASWKEKLCPFEKVKKWKNGVSVKCPGHTEVRLSRSDKDEVILELIKVKRACECVECKRKMENFLKLSS